MAGHRRVRVIVAKPAIVRFEAVAPSEPAVTGHQQSLEEPKPMD
jgi:hypothetical protein